MPERRTGQTNVPFFFAWLALAAAAAPQSAPDCVPLPVSVQVEPWRATLSWPAGPTPSPFFVEYKAGKFPTQLEVVATSGAASASVEASNLVPGRSYLVEICEPRVVGGCPARDPARACTTTVTVAVPLAYAGMGADDPDRARCTTEQDVVYQGESPGGPDTGPLRTASAAACCDTCAATEPNLPYRDACRFFAFDPRTRVCVLASTRGSRRAAPGLVSGRVVAWPRPRRRSAHSRRRKEYRPEPAPAHTRGEPGRTPGTASVRLDRRPMTGPAATSGSSNP